MSATRPEPPIFEMVALAALAFLAAFMLSRPAPAAELGYVNSCTHFVGFNELGDPAFLPCSQITPTNYPQEWVDAGLTI